MNVQSRIVVTAAEFTRQFGQLRHALGDAPVFVTHHGRETHVLLTKARHEALRQATAGEATPAPAPDAVLQYLQQGVIALDRDGAVRSANPAALTLLDCTADFAVGLPLLDLVPALRGSLVETHLRRAQLSGEPTAADLPHPVRPQRWLAVAVRPDATGATLLLSDITAEVQRERLADRPAAIALAAAVHPGVATFRLTPRGTIAAADDTACALLGLPEERLRRAGLVELAPTAQKAALRACVERVIGGGGPESCDTLFLANDGGAVPVTLALAELRGIYGTEGVSVVACRR